MPLILPGNVASATASTTYDVDNSCRFNDGDAPKLNRTLGTATSRKKWTMSFWVKRGTLTNQMIMTTASANSQIKFDDNHRFQVNDVTTIVYVTNRVFRDVSAWYHIVIAVDTTDGTAGDRIKIYVNGVEETSFATETDPSVNYDCDINNAIDHKFASYDGSTDYAFDGYLAEVVFIDGLALAPTEFGEFDSDSPTIWKPKDPSGLTFGTNGFYLDFEASDNLGNDANGGTDWTETNLAAADQSTDTPTNNFCTMNPLDNYYANSTFSEGNCTIVQGSSTYAHNLSTIAVTAGKWYAEAKLTTDSEHALVGITDTPAISVLVKILGSAAHDYSIKQANGDLFNNVGDDPSNDATNYAAAYAQNDIIGIALDCDNNKLYFSKGGAWSDGSGSWDSTTFNASVGAITITAPASTDNGHYFFASGDYGGAVCNWEWNFGGCPPNTISSGNADGNGYGNMEYAIPDSYFCLCSKNLAEYG